MHEMYNPGDDDDDDDDGDDVDVQQQYRTYFCTDWDDNGQGRRWNMERSTSQ